MLLHLFICYRHTATHSFDSSHAAFGSFGFLPNATAAYHFHLTSGTSAALRFYILPESDYLRFIASDDFETRARDCVDAPVPPLTDLNITLSWPNDTCSYQTQIPKKSVLMPFALHCAKELPFVSYEITVEYDNAGTKLDYRDVPNLISLPVLTGLLGLLILVWIAASLLLHRAFARVHLVITGLLFLYLLTLVLTFIWYKHADVSDTGTGWQICCIVFDGLYWSLLLIFLLIASSGWGTMQTFLTAKKIGITVASSVTVVALLNVMRHVTLGFWVLGMFVFVGIGGYFMLEELMANANAAKSHVKAHLYVIRRDGFDPRTTPVFDKFRTYSAFTFFVTISFAVIVILVLLLELVDADNWIVMLFYYGYHLCLLAGLGWLYRPRGEVVDKYFRVDEGEGGQRDEIDLEDIDGFDVNAAQGTKPWDGAAVLPLEPVVTDRSGAGGKRVALASLQQPLAVGSNYT
jgi:hypothetical protein